MTRRELRAMRIDEIANNIYDAALAAAAHGQVNHFEIVKALVTRIVEQDERLDRLEERLDAITTGGL